MKKSILVSLLASVAMLLSIGMANAQTVTKSKDFSAFTGIEAGYKYDITIKHGPEYKVEWTVDEIISSLVDIYQKGTTLYVGFNEKGLTKDMKNHYKGKNAPKMVLKATVYTPQLSALILNDNVHVEASSVTFTAESFSVTMKDKAALTTLKVDAKTAFFDMYGESVAKVEFKAPRITVKAEKKATITLNQESEQILVKAKGSSTVNIAGNSGVVEVESEGSAYVNCEKGSANKLNITSKGSAEFDGITYQFQTGEISLAGAKAYVYVANEMKLNLKKDSVVSFVEDPVINIVNVEKATITHFKGKKK